MKRSEVNKAIKEMEALAAKHGFALPPFCNWTAEDWQDKGSEYDEIRDNMLVGTLRITAWGISRRWDLP